MAMLLKEALVMLVLCALCLCLGLASANDDLKASTGAGSSSAGPAGGVTSPKPPGGVGGGASGLEQSAALQIAALLGAAVLSARWAA